MKRNRSYNGILPPGSNCLLLVQKRCIALFCWSLLSFSECTVCWLNACFYMWRACVYVIAKQQWKASCLLYEPIKPNRSIKYDKPHFFQGTKTCVYANKKKNRTAIERPITSVRLIRCHDKCVRLCFIMIVCATAAADSRQRRDDDRYTQFGTSNILCSHFPVSIALPYAKMIDFRWFLDHKKCCIHLSSTLNTCALRTDTLSS